jgi:L-seryl-tRNA(Ser) seleniumtransferase
MLRVDKITLSILEETIKAYLLQNYEQIPTLNLLFQSINSLEKRVEKLQKSFSKDICEIIHSTTFMGGGTLPNRKFPTVALHIKGKAMELEKKFRKKDLIGRIEKDKFLIDFRSILPSLDDNVKQIIKEVLV